MYGCVTSNYSLNLYLDVFLVQHKHNCSSRLLQNINMNVNVLQYSRCTYFSISMSYDFLLFVVFDRNVLNVVVLVVYVIIC